MAISWPGHIKDVGGIRTQFHHIIDIVPTILEAAGIQAPTTVNGITQKPIEGVSMAYTFDQANERPRPSATRSISRWPPTAEFTTTDGWLIQHHSLRRGTWRRANYPMWL